MTRTPDVTLLAHHGLLLAIPAFVPALVVVGVVVYIAMRDRRSDAPHSDRSDASDQDGNP